MGQLGCAKYKISLRNSLLAQKKKHKVAVLTLCLFFFLLSPPLWLISFKRVCVCDCQRVNKRHSLLLCTEN